MNILLIKQIVQVATPSLMEELLSAFSTSDSSSELVDSAKKAMKWGINSDQAITMHLGLCLVEPDLSIQLSPEVPRLTADRFLCGRRKRRRGIPEKNLIKHQTQMLAKMPAAEAWENILQLQKVEKKRKQCSDISLISYLLK
jgi:hypothetical protein